MVIFRWDKHSLFLSNSLGSANGGNGESKVDLKGRPRYNGRQLVSWKQDVVEKFEKTKEALILRHHHEVR